MRRSRRPSSAETMSDDDVGTPRARPRALGPPLGARARLVHLRRRRRVAGLHAPARAPPRGQLQPAVAALRQLQRTATASWCRRRSPPTPTAEQVFLRGHGPGARGLRPLVELGLAEGRSARVGARRRPLRAAQRRRDQDRRHHERAASCATSSRCAAATAPSGRSARWPGSCAAWSRSSRRRSSTGAARAACTAPAPRAR